MSCSIFNSEILSLVHELRQSTIISVTQFACTTVETLVRTLTCRYLLVRKRYIRLTAAMCWILLNASCLSKNVHTLSLLHLYYRTSFMRHVYCLLLSTLSPRSSRSVMHCGPCCLSISVTGWSLIDNEITVNWKMPATWLFKNDFEYCEFF